MIIRADLENTHSEAHKDFSQMGQRFYRASYDKMYSKRLQWEIRYSLYNNQMREENAIGDPLLFATHQTLLASLYNDQLLSRFKVSKDGDGNRTEKLNNNFKADYDLMNKSELDYYWDWDATFHGKGFLLNYEFDRDILAPKPSIIDPMHVIYDPDSLSIHGLNGKKKSGWFGWEDLTTKEELKELPGSFNLVESVSSSYQNSLVQEAKQARDEAQNLTTTDNSNFWKLGDKEQIVVWNIFSIVDNELVLVRYANKGSIIVGFDVLDKKFNNQIPVIERQIYPSNDFWGSSVPDFVEDKQRGRAKIQNISLEGLEFNVYGMYLANQKDVDVQQLSTPKPNKVIGVNGDVNNKITPIQRQQVTQDVEWMLGLMKGGAEQAIGTPAIQQGMTPDTARTATELAQQRQTIDKRFSLSAKIFGWSEKHFWDSCYTLYDIFLTSGDKKDIIIEGALGDSDDEITRKDIISDTSRPQIVVESAAISEAKRSYDLQVHSNLLGSIISYPDANMRYGYKKLAQLSGYTNEEINILLPPTAEELHADKENKYLSDNKSTKVSITDDHKTHLMIHADADDTSATRAHNRTHEIALMMARQKPEVLPVNPSVNANDNQSQEAIAADTGQQTPGFDYQMNFPNKT